MATIAGLGVRQNACGVCEVLARGVPAQKVLAARARNEPAPGLF
jgi:hypothetical protein